MTEISKITPEVQQPNQSANQAQVAPQAMQQQVQQPQFGANQDGNNVQLDGQFEEIRLHLQKAVDVLNRIVSSVNSATEVNRGLAETMSKVFERIDKLDSNILKTIGDINAVNQAQLKEQFDEPKEPKKLEGTGETTADDDAEPSEEELKEKVPGKQTLGQEKKDEGSTEKSARREVVKTVKAPSAPTKKSEETTIDVNKSMISEVLAGHVKMGDIVRRGRN